MPERSEVANSASSAAASSSSFTAVTSKNDELLRVVSGSWGSRVRDVAVMVWASGTSQNVEPKEPSIFAGMDLPPST
ncbi:hypothetical protein PC116_g25768 [Phytophthora cactorum]|uniref:Uncharacterized protein n=1 Tax=Phytophthora cactorum TaxID=29920 RepID=A0A8T1JN86_9STRA|nr:hypothetical protein PC114_g23868 [Phytophthora cactorum]KAG2894021.1 hypothetical protein PC117_g23606 [Phytophthora cactorum]KAG2971582.1 hypothetical protein PC119_g23348 [Phytophthora cactorum]KAG2990073.1 hypothetical protein PC120_g23038 [Phytophthora cactorum]KAG3145447.1 hypothetical protein PC128_g24220 [Phytophthora cactorum]